MTDYQVLVQVEKCFDAIAKDKAAVAQEKEVVDNGILTVPANTPLPDKPAETPISSPRVETVPPPRVAITPRLVVVCPTVAIVVSTKKGPHQPAPHHIPPYDEPVGAPAHNTQAKRIIQRSLTQETILSCIEMSTANATPQNMASRKFPMQMLCKIAGAVMDANGELLQYKALMMRP